MPCLYHKLFHECEWPTVSVRPATVWPFVSFTPSSHFDPPSQSPFSSPSSSSQPMLSTLPLPTQYSSSSSPIVTPSAQRTVSSLDDVAKHPTHSTTTIGAPGIMLVHSAFSRYCHTPEMVLPSSTRPDNIEVIMDYDNGSCFLCFENGQRYLQTTFAVHGGQKGIGILITGYNLTCSNPEMVIFRDSSPEDGKCPIKYECMWQATDQTLNSELSLCEFWCDGNFMIGPIHVSVVLDLFPWKSNNLLPVKWCETMLISVR